MSDRSQYRPWNLELNGFCTLMHLSQLTGILIPGLGFFLPIIMWVSTKNESAQTDAHGRIILNWMFSFFIYFLVIYGSFGWWGVTALIAYNFVFIIIGTIQANKGVSWRYPLSIPFFKAVTYN